MDILNDKSILELEVTEETKTHLLDISKWANIYATVSFFSLGISLLATLLYVGKANRFGFEGSGILIAQNLITTIIVGAISLLLNITLYNAAKNIKLGLESSDQGFFNVGIGKLKNFFKITGILIIVLLAIFVLIMLIGIIVGMMKAR